jgi:hypothetical protein
MPYVRLHPTEYLEPYREMQFRRGAGVHSIGPGLPTNTHPPAVTEIPESLSSPDPKIDRAPRSTARQNEGKLATKRGCLPLVPHPLPSALVAQWIEHRFPKPGVGGSIPPGGTETVLARGGVGIAGGCGRGSPENPGQDASSFSTVPTPWPSEMVAAPGFDRSIVNVSVGSSTESPLTDTSMLSGHPHQRR